MSRKAKIIIFALVLIGAIFKKNFSNGDQRDSVQDKKYIDTSIYNEDKSDEIKRSEEKRRRRISEINESLENMRIKTIPNLLDDVYEIHPTPKNGFSPYDKFFGKGIYNNSSRNEFVIKNSNSTDAVVLLVDAYSGRKVRNEFIRKGSNFTMTGVPNGTYFLEWTSGGKWSPNLNVGRLKGGFQKNSSFTKTRDRQDWMKVSGYQQWTVTLYTVSGGDVESEGITADEFGN